MMRSVYLAYYLLIHNHMVAIIVADSEEEAREFAGDKAERVQRVTTDTKGEVGVYYV